MNCGEIIDMDWLFDYSNRIQFTTVMATTLASYPVNHLNSEYIIQ